MRAGYLTVTFVWMLVSCGKVSTAPEDVAGSKTVDGSTTVDDPEAHAGPSCKGLEPTCGASQNHSCCSSPLVPGGTFSRSYDGVYYKNPKDVATVSDFRLDMYEITVGRFRNFVAGYPENLPASGAGKNPNNPSDPGWDSSWNAQMPKTQAELLERFKECGAAASGTQSWTDTPDAYENVAMNCISWSEAFAFCIWDGGRLPTEAEWNYAAAGGSEQRVYPWSIPATSKDIGTEYAVYKQGMTTRSVGSKSPKGDGKWGHADLVGNAAEYVLDCQGRYFTPCDNCANLTCSEFETDRVNRGGSFQSGMGPPYNAAPNYRENYAPADWRSSGLGARCARVGSRQKSRFVAQRHITTRKNIDGHT